MNSRHHTGTVGDVVLHGQHVLLVGDAQFGAHVRFGLGELHDKGYLPVDLQEYNPLEALRTSCDSTREAFARVLAQALILGTQSYHESARELLVRAMLHARLEDEQVLPVSVRAYLGPVSRHLPQALRVRALACAYRALSPLLKLEPRRELRALLDHRHHHIDIGCRRQDRTLVRCLGAALIVQAEDLGRGVTLDLGRVDWLVFGLEGLVAEAMESTCVVRARHPEDLSGTHWWETCQARVYASASPSLPWSLWFGAEASRSRASGSQLINLAGETHVMWGELSPSESGTFGRRGRRT